MFRKQRWAGGGVKSLGKKILQKPERCRMKEYDAKIY